MEATRMYSSLERHNTDKVVIGRNRRNSSLSQKDPRRDTATFEKNALIKEEDSIDESSLTDIEKKKTVGEHRKRDSIKRKSQHIIEANLTSILKESNDKSEEDVSN